MKFPRCVDDLVGSHRNLTYRQIVFPVIDPCISGTGNNIEIRCQDDTVIPVQEEGSLVPVSRQDKQCKCIAGCTGKANLA